MEYLQTSQVERPQLAQQAARCIQQRQISKKGGEKKFLPQVVCSNLLTLCMKNLLEATLAAETKGWICQRPENRSEVTRKSHHPAAKQSEKRTNRHAQPGTRTPAAVPACEPYRHIPAHHAGSPSGADAAQLDLPEHV